MSIIQISAIFGNFQYFLEHLENRNGWKPEEQDLKLFQGLQLTKKLEPLPRRRAGDIIYI